MNTMGESPQIIAFGYYDGPTNGILKWQRTGQEYQFDCFDTILQDECDMRGIKLYPLPSGTFDNVAERLYQGAPPQKISVVIGDFYKKVQAEVDAIYRDLEQSKATLEKVAAWHDPGLIVLAETTDKLDDDSALREWLGAVAKRHNPLKQQITQHPQ